MEPSKSKQPDPEVCNAIEAALMTAQKPLDVRALARLFPRGDPSRPSREAIREAVKTLAERYESRGVELVEVAGGWRIQARSHYASALGRLWEEKPPRYSRALLETLAIIAYRQPVTRGDIESIRGISVNPNIIRTLAERGWVRVVGHREVPGRPELFATAREFLDYFGLRHLRDLPPLPEPRQPPAEDAERAAAGTSADAAPGEGQVVAGNTEDTPATAAEPGDPASVVEADKATEKETDTAAYGGAPAGNGSVRWPSYAASGPGTDTAEE